MRLLVPTAMVAVLAALGACAGAPVATADPSPAPADEGEAIEAFRSLRDEICEAGSEEIAAINATLEGASGEEAAAALRQVAARIEVAQAALDELDVPPAMAAFVAEDAERRAERLRLVDELADALESGDVDAADATDQALAAVNIETEAAEDANRLEHCP